MIKMPLVEHVKSIHSSVSLSDALLIGCQHILETTHLMFRSLYEFGLNPKNIFLLGKCYSSNKSVWQEMHQEGIRVSPLSFFFDSNQSFDTQFCRIVAQFLEHTLCQVDLSKFNKIILIDDGGQLLTLSSEVFKEYKNIIGIEQTTSGYEKIRSRSLQFPVINVARSQAKLIYESPMIADTIVKKALRRIAKLKCDPGKILIIGNGAIGSSIYRALKDDYKVQTYDKIPNNRKINKEYFDFDDYLGQADLIIGCTGETSVPFSKHKSLKKECVLFSASSSDREFDAVHIRKKSANIKNCHDDIEIEGITLLNCGFPINFDGARNSVVPSKIQFTRALLVAAILQACETSEGSLDIIPLDIEMQRDIVSKYLQLYPTFSPNATQAVSSQNNRPIQETLTARKEKELNQKSY